MANEYSGDAGFEWNPKQETGQMIESDYLKIEEHDILSRDDVEDCPFCGYPPQWLRGGKQVDGFWSYVVVCDNCGSYGPGIANAEKDNAFMVGMVEWNKRKN